MYILAGEFKGRKILPPPRRSITRPITALAKKSLFDMLAPYLPDALVLDLYSGTGTIGLEALSRGAASCCFAEYDRGVVACLKKNIEAFEVENRCRIWSGDISRRLAGWLAQLEAPVDLVFVDPPYVDSRQWDWAGQEKAIFEPLAAALSEDGLVILRTQGKSEVPERLATLSAERVKKYGDMVITFFQRN